MKKTLLFFGFNRTLTATAEKADGGASSFAAGTTPTWSLDDSAANTGATITPAADGLTAVVSVPGTSTNAGKVLVKVTGEGDPEAGVDTITGTFELDVCAVEATQVVVTAGDMVANA